VGKRLERYFQPELLEKLPGLINHRISLVMKDEHVHDGTLIQFSAVVQLKDKLGRKHMLASQDITELIFDYEASW
jgi:hypothetical protein